MMEQLAERRMQREEDTQYGIAAAHQTFHGHNHGPLDEDDYDDDDEEEEDYDSQEEEEFDEDEMVGTIIPRSLITSTNSKTGCHDRRAAHARRAANVPNICCPDV